jgi:ribosomal protein S18 acetylase RimI-like enzyme
MCSSPVRARSRLCHDVVVLIIRAAHSNDRDAIWAILEPIIRAGDTYCVPPDMVREEAIAYWFANTHEVFVADNDGSVVGTYFLRPNQMGGGSHVANCGYMTAPAAFGRGVARAMCMHSLEQAKGRGFRSMQFNFVVSTNDRAVRLWESCGFAIVGRLPQAFLHPAVSYVEAYVMYRVL